MIRTILVEKRGKGFMKISIGTKSYMDVIIPRDLHKTILEYKDQYEGNEYFLQIEKYFQLQKETIAWHKNMKLPIILSEKQKQELTPAELCEYYKKLTTIFLKKGRKQKIKRLSNEEEQQLTEKQYYMYLKELRLHDEKSLLNNLPLIFSKLIHPILCAGLKSNRIKSGVEVEIMNQRIPKEIGKRPIIFVLTHVGKDDISVFNDGVPKKHYTILSGDYESLHNNLESFVFRLNKTKFFDMNSAQDRGKVVNEVAAILKRDNLLCSMEAAWNITPNVIVQDIFKGMILAGEKSNGVILAAGIERFSNNFYGINIGEEFFDPKAFLKQTEETLAKSINSKEEIRKIAEEEATIEVRQMLARAKLPLYFSDKIVPRIKEKRETIGNFDEYNKKFKEDILSGWTFTEETIHKKAYRNPQNPTLVFSYLNEKYKNLEDIYYALQSGEFFGEEETILNKKFTLLYAQLLGDMKKPEYPNDIHNYLCSIYNTIQTSCYSYKENNKIEAKYEKVLSEKK